MDISEECTGTPPEMREAAQTVYNNLLPTKSKNVYMKAYYNFKDWCLNKKVTKCTENVLLVYFQEQAENKKASSLWAIFSMLKSTLALKENIELKKYHKLISFLKRQNESYTPKKSSVFLKEEINKFLTSAPDVAFLSTKVTFSIVIKF